MALGRPHSRGPALPGVCVQLQAAEGIDGHAPLLSPRPPLLLFLTLYLHPTHEHHFLVLDPEHTARFGRILQNRRRKKNKRKAIPEGRREGRKKGKRKEGRERETTDTLGWPGLWTVTLVLPRVTHPLPTPGLYKGL